MKKLQRFLLGLLTSALLSLGFVRAAELTAQPEQASVAASQELAAPGCQMPCNLPDIGGN